MKKGISTSADVKRLVYLAIFSALIVVTQTLSIPIFGAFETSALTVACIIIGAALLGIRGGAILGGVFSIVVMLLPGTMFYIQESLLFTVIVVFAKGIAAGVVAGVVYKLLSRFNKYLAVIVSGIAAVTVNTGIFILGSILFFNGVFADFVETILLVSYPIEIAVSVILAPATLRIVNIKQK